MKERVKHTHTPSRREMELPSFEELAGPQAPVRRLISSKSNKSGRNNQGRITVRRRGGGVKQKYRIIDFVRKKGATEGVVEAIQYDPNRTSRIALVSYKDGEKNYILAPNLLVVGSKITASDESDIQVGNCKKLRFVPVGTLIHNLELNPNGGGQLVRSAGTYAQLMAKEGGSALVRLPSGEIRRLSLDCKATIGQVGNIKHEQVNWGKAGKSRLRGIRPSVRGVAMNPVDHPHGGGEGKTSGGRHPVTPWGKSTKGLKTRKCKRTDKYIEKRRK